MLGWVFTGMGATATAVPKFVCDRFGTPGPVIPWGRCVASGRDLA